MVLLSFSYFKNSEFKRKKREKEEKRGKRPEGQTIEVCWANKRETHDFRKLFKEPVAKKPVY